ncbi:hypothetical protein H4R33_000683 [Dimargaris cristalligena]|nr:hypothetical protein H4R33_000683 [Dimargaris cristalligena]
MKVAYFQFAVAVFISAVLVPQISARDHDERKPSDDLTNAGSLGTGETDQGKYIRYTHLNHQQAPDSVTRNGKRNLHNNGGYRGGIQGGRWPTMLI